MANRPPQKTVRVGQFDRALQNFNIEMGAKTAQALARFHGMYIAPLERRILLIETLTGIRLVRWIRWTLYRGLRLVIDRVWHPFYMRFSEAIPEEVKKESDGSFDHVEVEDLELKAIVSSDEPDPEDDGVSRILSLN